MKPALPNSHPLTTARLSLGLTGPAILTSAQLQFQLDHALARDAVHAALDVPLLERGLRERGFNPLALRSAARDRKEYLRRPDLGRRLSEDSREALKLGAPCPDSGTWEDKATNAFGPPELIFILADGLSALAVERHALPLLDALDPRPSALGPVVLATQARVALADEIGQLLGAQLTVLLIGERPGLSSPDSLGVYITWSPLLGRTDAERNCISNIRAEGLSYAEAAHRIAHYIAEARRLETSGIALKDPQSPQLLNLSS